MIPNPIHVDFIHHDAAAAIMRTAPVSGAVRDLINSIWSAATSANIPWLKVFTAFATMAAGGFSPAAIAAGLAMLFGSNVPPALKSQFNAATPELETHAKATMASIAV